jgi:hypothetical protein
MSRVKTRGDYSQAELKRMRTVRSEPDNRFHVYAGGPRPDQLQQELATREQLYMLPSELMARGFVVTRGKWLGSGLPVLPDIRYHSWMGKNYVGFSVR